MDGLRYSTLLCVFLQPRAITADERKFMAYATLRKALRDSKNVGKHEKKLAAEKEAASK